MDSYPKDPDPPGIGAGSQSMQETIDIWFMEHLLPLTERIATIADFPRFAQNLHDMSNKCNLIITELFYKTWVLV